MFQVIWIRAFNFISKFQYQSIEEKKKKAKCHKPPKDGKPDPRGHRAVKKRYLYILLPSEKILNKIKCLKDK